MLPGELVMRPLELHRQDTNLTDPVAGGLSQLHVLIPKVPCQTHTCCQASPDLRSVQILQPITFCFLFIFSLFPQNSRAAWSGHDCHIGCIEAGWMVGWARPGFESDTMWDEDMQNIRFICENCCLQAVTSSSYTIHVSF